jgi:phenylacetate-CoA ligase
MSRFLTPTLIRGFPRVLPPGAAVVMDVHQQLQAFERLPLDAQQKMHVQQLGRLMSHAWRHSPFWRERLASVSERTPGGKGIVSLSMLPVLTRNDLQGAFEAMRAHLPGWKPNMVHQTRTSGSTGRPVRSERFLPLYWPLHCAMLLTDNRWHRRDADQPIAVIVDAPDGRHPAWDDVSRMLGHEGPTHLRNLIEHDPDTLVPWLADVKARYLATTPTMAMRLAEIAIARGVRISLAQIITFGETVKPELRQIVQNAFGARVTDRYSCEELGALALQCPKHDHYHVMAASVIVEIVDDQGHPCPPGEPGRVLLTGLQSFAMPLIRYEVGDYAEWGEPCDCGLTLPVIARIWGRERSFIRLPDGSLRLARLTGEYWREIAPVGEYRVVQYADGLIEAFVTCHRPLTDAEHGAMKAMLQKVLGHPFEVLVTQCENIEWGSRWKREDVVRVDHLRETPVA